MPEELYSLRLNLAEARHGGVWAFCKIIRDQLRAMRMDLTPYTARKVIWGLDAFLNGGGLGPIAKLQPDAKYLYRLVTGGIVGGVDYKRKPGSSSMYRFSDLYAHNPDSGLDEGYAALTQFLQSRPQEGRQEGCLGYRGVSFWSDTCPCSTHALDALLRVGIESVSGRQILMLRVEASKIPSDSIHMPTEMDAVDNMVFWPRDHNPSVCLMPGSVCSCEKRGSRYPCCACTTEACGQALDLTPLLVAQGLTGGQCREYVVHNLAVDKVFFKRFGEVDSMELVDRCLLTAEVVAFLKQEVATV